jgi:spore germination protein PA
VNSPAETNLVLISPAFFQFNNKGCARMPAIVGAFKINAVGTSGVVHIGDCITISPQAEVRTFAGAGSFNTGDSLKVMNYKNATNVYDNDVVDQPIAGNA